jgi:plasmid maintenance system antidote protein VapI/Zn-dependent peptidase ImmA (M78 family)
MVDDTRPFTPDWVSPPGETIAAVLSERGLTFDDFARIIRRPPGDVEQLIDGEATLTADLARLLADTLGASAEFWTRREVRYRQDLERLREEASRAVRLNWLDEVPLKDMIGWGWLKPAADPVAVAVAALRFFGVSSVDSWRSLYSEALHPAAFRTSAAFESQPGAVAAWLRQGEIAASSIRCERWDSEHFRAQLALIRALTREKDPEVFLPELTRLCAACGVAVVALRAPTKCRASGAVRFLSPTRALLMLSFRYLSDDQFWFTFFHEAAHLLLHPARCFFLEGDERLMTAEEEEANTFAANTLAPPEYHAEMLGLHMQMRPVTRFARKIGVSPGIVVGQLQHRGRIGYDRLNRLKRRYAWADA